MAFPVFASGDILNASDMNAVGLWRIGGATFTTVAGFSLPNDSFTSTYTNYRLIVRLETGAAGATLTGRFRASGTDNTNNTYRGLAAAPTSDTTSFTLGSFNHTSSGEYAAVFEFFGPKEARTTPVSYVNYQQTTAPTRTSLVFTGVYYGTEQFDSFSFISSANVTGKYWLYGYRD